MTRGSLVAVGVVAAALAACSDQGPVSAPGVVTATLLSPHGAEGAAVVSLAGEGIGPTTALGDVVLFRSDQATGITVVLLNPGGGGLSFRVELADTTRLPTATVAQVADTSDQLRGSLANYRVGWSR